MQVPILPPLIEYIPPAAPPDIEPIDRNAAPPQPNPNPAPPPNPNPAPAPAPGPVVPPAMSDYVRERKEEVERLEVQLRVQQSTQWTFKALAAVFAVAAVASFVAACIVESPALLAGIAVICAVAALYFLYMMIVSEVTIGDEIGKLLITILKANRGKIEHPELKALFTKFAKEVEKLKLVQIKGAHELTRDEFKEFIKTLGTYFTGLSELYIEGFQNWNAEVELDPLRTVRLKKLEFHYCNINTAQMEDLRVLTSLHTLVLRSCHALTRDGIRAVAGLDIAALDLSGTRLTPLNYHWEEVYAFAEEHCERLPEPEKKPFMDKVRNHPEYILDLFDKSRTGNFPVLSHINELGGFRNLKHLTVTHINDDGIKELVTHVNNLVSLKILYSPTLKGETFDELAKLPHLVEVGLTRCPELTGAGFGKLITNRKIRSVQFLDAASTFANEATCLGMLLFLNNAHFFPFEESGKKKLPPKPDGEPGVPTVADLTGYWVRELEGHGVENVD